MINPSSQNPKVRAIAKVLAMIAEADSNLVPHHTRPVRETDEWLWESATEFCAAHWTVMQGVQGALWNRKDRTIEAKVDPATFAPALPERINVRAV